MDCWVAERMGIGESDNIPSRLLMEGAAGSVRLDVPEMASVEEVLTMFVRSISAMVMVPEVVRAALVSERDEVLELPEPMVIVGASLTAVMDVEIVAVLSEMADVLPLLVVSMLTRD